MPQYPSPQMSLQGVQSKGQVTQFSGGLQTPSPQAGQVPQSGRQELQLSVWEQNPSPQTAGQSPQSQLQERHSSEGPQTPSPQ